MPRLSRLAAAAFAALAATVLAPGPSRAAEDPPPDELEDGPTACRALDERNARELEAWEAQQPKVPYKRPNEPTLLGAPWGRFVEGAGAAGGLWVATLVPHVGGQLRASGPTTLLSLPWSFPFGPAYACSRKRGTFDVEKLRGHRVLFEPGLVAGEVGVGVMVRPGYRFVYHPTDWVIGVGGGVGFPMEFIQKEEPFRLGLGPEAVAHFGHCCGPGYFTLTARYERYFAGKSLDVGTVSLGYVWF